MLALLGVALLLFVFRAASRSDDPVKGSRVRVRRPKPWIAMLTTAVCLASGLAAWSLQPPDRGLGDPQVGLVVSVEYSHRVWAAPNTLHGEAQMVEVEDFLPLTGIRVVAERYGEDEWLIYLIGHTPDIRRKATVTLEGLSPSRCARVSTKKPWPACADPSQDDEGITVPIRNWQKRDGMSFGRSIDMSLEVGYTFVVAIPVFAKADQIGLNENSASIKIFTPFVSTGVDGRVPAEFRLVTDRGPALEWSGAAPSAVTSEYVAWDYSLPERTRAYGRDPHVAADDQRQLFIASFLAGMSTTLLITAAQLWGAYGRRIRFLRRAGRV